VSYASKLGVVVAAGNTYRVAIPAPARGEIIRAQAIQSAGSNTTFSFLFFNSAQSCPPDPLDVNGQPQPPTPPVVDPMVEYAGQIGPSRDVKTAGDRYVLSDGSDGGWLDVPLPYVNADGASGTTAKGKLYLKFVAGGAGTYNIFLTVKTDSD
jgi:hypothetical protein